MKLLKLIILVMFSETLLAQMNFFSGFVYTYKTTLLNGDTGNDYTFNEKPLSYNVSYNFIVDSNIVYVNDNGRVTKKIYAIKDNFLTIKQLIKRQDKIDTIFDWFSFEKSENYMILNELRNELDEKYFLKKHYLKKEQVNYSYDKRNSYEIFTIVEEMPVFKGGNEEMFRFISNEVVYPKNVVNPKSTERVYLKILVSPSGKIVDAEILATPRLEFAKEAMRVIRKMPDFVSGKQNGKSVYVYLNLPIAFKNK